MAHSQSPSRGSDNMSKNRESSVEDTVMGDVSQLFSKEKTPDWLNDEDTKMVDDESKGNQP
ncbi:hypothetical protein KC315_g12526, partial [Hortaea werneckii]